jgi:ribosome-binding factor A
LLTFSLFFVLCCRAPMANLAAAARGLLARLALGPLRETPSSPAAALLLLRGLATTTATAQTGGRGASDCDSGAAAAPSPPPPSTSTTTLADAGAFAAADALWPTSRRQKAAAARIRRALAAVLADPAAAGLRGPDVHTLTVRCGLALGGVRAGPDGRTAHVLYDVTPGTEAAAAGVLAGPLAGPLRAAVGRALGARRAPVLKWTPDRLGGEATAIVAELERLGLPSRVK